MSNTKQLDETIIFKKNVKKILKEKGMSVADLCKAISKDRYYLAHLKTVRLNIMVDISNALGCKASDLMEGI